MEGISMDGVVEIGHHVILDVLDTPLMDRRVKFLETTLTLLFGGVEQTLLWKIKKDIWVMWNLRQRHTVGRNDKAVEIILSTTNPSRFDGFRQVLDNIGGYVAIISQTQGALPNSYLLHGRESDRGGGISTQVM